MFEIAVSELKDIYNANEFGLFYQCVPNKTYQLRSEKCSGGKLSKVRITGWHPRMLLAINYRCLSLEKPENHAASKTLSFYLVDIDSGVPRIFPWVVIRTPTTSTLGGSGCPNKFLGVRTYFGFQGLDLPNRGL